MHYEGNMIRPPSEADSILLQVTLGCSHNKCTFCPAFKGKPFGIKDPSVVLGDIDYAARHYPKADRVFLCDGDALILPQPRLVEILQRIRTNLPWVSRVGTYANAKSIARKTDNDLRELRELGLRIIHIGLESGDNETLMKVGKFGTAEFIIEQSLRIRSADIKLFVTVILGLAGAARSQEHAIATGTALSKINPEYVGALSLMLPPEAPLYRQWKDGGFVLPSQHELLKELKTLFTHTSLNPGYFYANHASNYLPIRARLPRDKQRTLDLVDRALEGDIALRPEWMRGL